MLNYVLVAVGGAAGSALGLRLLREPSETRVFTTTAVVCALMGALGTQGIPAALTALVGFGVLGSAASMVAIGVVSPLGISSGAILSGALRVTGRLARYCLVGVTFALVGYLAATGAITLYIKLG